MNLIIEANKLGKEGFVVVFVPREGESLYGWKEYDNIFDSAQEVRRNQYQDLNNDNAVVIFSFYPTKNLGGYGDGGAIITNNKNLYEKIKLMRIDCAHKK